MVLTPEGKLVIFLGIINLIGLLWATRSILKWRKKTLAWTIGWFLVCLLLPIIGTVAYAVSVDKIFKRSEIVTLLVATLLLGFMMSFRQWGLESFSAFEGIINWLKSSILAGIALSIHASFQKKVASWYDASVKYQIWPVGVVVALILIFATNGWFVFAALFGITISTPWLFRPGRLKEEWHLGPEESAKIALAGPLIHIVTAIITKGIFMLTQIEFLREFMFVNIWLAVFMVIPFSLATSPWRRYFMREYTGGAVGPTAFGTRFLKKDVQISKLEGEYALFGARNRWFISLIFVISTGAFLLLFDPITSLVLSLIISLVFFFKAYNSLEGGGNWPANLAKKTKK